MLALPANILSHVLGLVVPDCASERQALEGRSDHVTLHKPNRNRGTSEANSAVHSLHRHRTAHSIQLHVDYARSPPLSAPTMISSGFTNAPVSQFLVFSTVIGALVATITDTRYYIHISVVPHIWTYGQFWRFFTWQTCFTNSTEVLFAVITFYQLRVIERLWGSRKFAVSSRLRQTFHIHTMLIIVMQSFLLATLPYTTLLPPLILTFGIRPLTFGRINHLPAGPTSILFALLANYYAAIPYTYRYKVSAFAPAEPNSQSNAQTATSIWSRSLTLTSKSLSYLPPLQLALSQFPGSFLTAAVGWAVGTAYRRDLLPGAAGWRMPGWMVGEEKKKGFEGLRARLDAEREREGGSGAATGILAGETGQGGARQRRTLGEMVTEQFRGRN
jgi:hypothetical protein